MSEPARYAVIGHPIKHSRSPFIHARFAAQVGHDLTYTTIDAPPASFNRLTREFFERGGSGLNVTVPNKEAAFQMVHELTERAERAGAVNTMALREDGGLLGDNTDGAGLARDLVNNHRVSVAGRRVLLLGAGGAARGVLAPLLGLRPSELTVVNRTVERAQALAEEFADLGQLSGIGYDELRNKPYDLVINATAASLAGEVPAMPPGVVDNHTICYDLAYSREETPFVRWAQGRGAARAMDGLGMLVEQAAESFYLWRGERPDTASVLNALAAELRG